MTTPAQSFCSPSNPANGFLCGWGWCPESRIVLVRGCERVGCCLSQIPVKGESFSYHYYPLVGDWITRLLLHIAYLQNIPLLKICTISVLFSAEKYFCLPMRGLLWHALMVWPLRSNCANLACTGSLDGQRQREWFLGRQDASRFLYRYVSWAVLMLAYSISRETKETLLLCPRAASWWIALCQKCQRAAS